MEREIWKGKKSKREIMKRKKLEKMMAKTNEPIKFQKNIQNLKQSKRNKQKYLDCIEMKGLETYQDSFCVEKLS